MKTRSLLALLIILTITAASYAQDEEPEKKGFKKENLFTGGGISLGFSSNTFQIGAMPFFGYSIAPWLDAGVNINYLYSSYRNAFINNPDDKLRRSTYGGGAFTRIYPVRFIFAQAQFEHNFISEKYIPANGGTSAKNKVEANSLLLGAGFSSDRYPGSGRPFFYLSLLFDVLNNDFSPYRRTDGSVIPILRGGLQIPLFQGSRRY